MPFGSAPAASALDRAEALAEAVVPIHGNPRR